MEDDLIPVGSKVRINCGIDGKTVAVGIIKKHNGSQTYPYLVELIAMTRDVTTGDVLDSQWNCTPNGIKEVLEVPSKHDPIAAYDRAMRGI